MYPINETPADVPGRDKDEAKPINEYVKQPEDRYQCRECENTFDDFGLLTAHLMHDHDDD